MFAPLPKHKAFKHLSSGFTLIGKPVKAKPSGFTIIELVVVVAILGIFVLIASQTLGLFTQQVNLNTTSQQIVSTLQLARNKTLAAEDESQYGVHFELLKYTLFKGSPYVSTDPDNVEYDLSTTEIYEINLTGGDEIIFDRIRGTTANSGNIKVWLLEDNSRTETILVNSSGSISLLESVNPSCPGMTCPRIVDARHLHFNLGWSILGASDLIFVFPDDSSYTETIPMAGFFNAGFTEFDWEGKITVNGSDQIFRVHTHPPLNVFVTTLSIHRDGQKNDKAVNISIDSNEIVSYNAVGDATRGNAGGMMEAQ